MTCPSKRKISAKEQERESNGRFAKKAQIIDDWGDDEDSGWDNHNNSWDDHDNSWDGHDNSWDDDLSNEKKVEVELVWSNDAHLEKKRESYLTGKTKKSTYFDKYGPSGSFMKAAKGTAKITTFLNKSLVPDDFNEIFDELENERNNTLDLNERIEQLKKELKEQQKLLTANYWLQHNHLPISHQ
ncbi:12474_t:CDS:2, partial [Funneliformis geosporum]